VSLKWLFSFEFTVSKWTCTYYVIKCFHDSPFGCFGSLRGRKTGWGFLLGMFRLEYKSKVKILQSPSPFQKESFYIQNSHSLSIHYFEKCSFWNKMYYSTCKNLYKGTVDPSQLKQTCCKKFKAADVRSSAKLFESFVRGEN
jgi:hypothetical protein